MQLVVDARGTVRCLYTEVLNFEAIGMVAIRRASHVEPDVAGQWWADLALVGGPRLGPFDRRSEALIAEQAWLQSNRLAPSKSNAQQI